MGKRGVPRNLKEAGTVVLLAIICANLCNLWIAHPGFPAFGDVWAGRVDPASLRSGLLDLPQLSNGGEDISRRRLGNGGSSFFQGSFLAPTHLQALGWSHDRNPMPISQFICPLVDRDSKSLNQENLLRGENGIAAITITEFDSDWE